MRLTLFSSGGVAGLTKSYSLNTDTLDATTRESLMRYVNHTHTHQPGRSLRETWSLENGKEIPLSANDLPAELQDLYGEMKKNLTRHQSR